MIDTFSIAIIALVTSGFGILFAFQIAEERAERKIKKLLDKESAGKYLN